MYFSLFTDAVEDSVLKLIFFTFFFLQSFSLAYFLAFFPFWYFLLYLSCKYSNPEGGWYLGALFYHFLVIKRLEFFCCICCSNVYSRCHAATYIFVPSNYILYEAIRYWFAKLWIQMLLLLNCYLSIMVIEWTYIIFAAYLPAHYILLLMWVNHGQGWGKAAPKHWRDGKLHCCQVLILGYKHTGWDQSRLVLTENVPLGSKTMTWKQMNAMSATNCSSGIFLARGSFLTVAVMGGMIAASTATTAALV